MDSKKIPIEYRKKVLILCNNYEDKHVLDTERALKLHGHDVKSLSTDLFPLSIKNTMKNFFFVMRSLYIVLKVILLQFIYDMDIIISDLHYLTTPILSAFCSVPIIINKSAFQRMKKNYIRSEVNLYIERKCNSWAEEIIVSNCCARAMFMVKNYPVKVPVDVLYPSVDVGPMEETNDLEWYDVFGQIPETAKVYLTMSVRDSYSDMIFAIEAFYKFIESVDIYSPHAPHLVILVKTTADYKIPPLIKYQTYRNVHFAENYCNEVRKAMLRNCFVFVDTSRYDIYNKHLLEAMYFGKPIITNLSGFGFEILPYWYDAQIVEYKVDKYAKVMLHIYKSESLTSFIEDLSIMYFQNNYSFEMYANTICNYVNHFTINKHLIYVDDKIEEINYKDDFDTLIEKYTHSKDFLELNDSPVVPKEKKAIVKSKKPQKIEPIAIKYDTLEEITKTEVIETQKITEIKTPDASTQTDFEFDTDEKKFLLDINNKISSGVLFPKSADTILKQIVETSDSQECIALALSLIKIQKSKLKPSDKDDSVSSQPDDEHKELVETVKKQLEFEEIYIRSTPMESYSDQSISFEHESCSPLHSKELLSLTRNETVSPEFDSTNHEM